MLVKKYCRMLQGEHFAILLTFIKLPFVIKIFGLAFLSGCFTQVLLYVFNTIGENKIIAKNSEFTVVLSFVCVER